MAIFAGQRFEDLRQRAERVVNEDHAAHPRLKKKSLEHELAVHSVELQMQNEALQEAHRQIEASRAEYRQLFDWAPAAYLVVGPDHQIKAANHAATAFLGGSELVGVPLARFVVGEEAEAFELYRRRVVGSSGRVRALFNILSQGVPRAVTVEGSCIDSATGEWCVVLVDAVPHPVATGQLHDEILVVDDMPQNLVATTAVLEPLATEVVTAESGMAALQLLQNHDFRLLIIDVNMPTMEGFELARRIRENERFRKIPIIFITALDRDDRKLLAAYELGVVDFLFKPVEAEVLRAKASVFIDLARHTESIREHERREHERLLEVEREVWREESMRRDMEQLSELNRRKDQFLAVLGHELRNPLTPLTASLSLLRRKIAQTSDIDSMFERTREIMDRHVQHLTRLAEDLVDVARVNSGKVELRKAPASMHDIVAQAVSSSRPLMDERRQTLKLQLPAESLIIECDRVRIVQVVTNLLNNAAVHSPAKARITIRCARVKGEVELSIEDNGHGIAPDLLPHIFDAFVQGNENQSRGLGLGLAIVERLTKLHGGTVSVQSGGEGCGSTFTVRLPLKTAVA